MSKMAHSVALRQSFLPPGTWIKREEGFEWDFSFHVHMNFDAFLLSLVWNIVVILTFSKSQFFILENFFITFHTQSIFLCLCLHYYYFLLVSLGLLFFRFLELNAHLICFKPYFLPVPLSLYISLQVSTSPAVPQKSKCQIFSLSFKSKCFLIHYSFLFNPRIILYYNK